MTNFLVRYQRKKSKKTYKFLKLIILGKELYDSKYPFQFTDYFLTWKTIHQFQVKSQIKQMLIEGIEQLKVRLFISMKTSTINLYLNKSETG